MQAERIQALLTELHDLVEASPEDVALMDNLTSSMHRLRLSEALDEQLSILAYCRALWDQEDVVACAWDCIHDLIGNQGVIPTPEQERNLTFLGYAPRPVTPEPAPTRKFSRKIR
jgi:hypothetical protein